ncbi:low-specificity L-threonine aldolase [Candidatus Uabimicrobium sp. HlEnr_7]|uniref:low-specificity L-threonine aldolase n=1 Tax=Candidatus Uabimicrobium helgolandensis TaxID=3095367 RepID=UPI0035576B63
MNNQTIDLRSDTVTQPCKEMRKSMAEAIVGDDMYGEDPTINQLQQLICEITGKEEALFVPTASMANQIAIKTLTVLGDAIAVLEHAHVYRFESGAAPVFSGVTLLQIGDINGCISINELQKIIPPDDQHYPPLTLLCMENTHNGQVVPLDNIAAVSDFCKGQGIKMHLDGARIFNASVATGIPVKDYAKHFDTVTICLSKGLGAPAGALICSSNSNIKKIHRFRKMMGGAMRQAGIIAAGGLYALKNNVSHLNKDHELAKYLATEIKKIKKLKIINDPIETNMIFVSYEKLQIENDVFQKHMSSKGIEISCDDAKKITRLVVHRDINIQQIDYLLENLNLLAQQ